MTRHRTALAALALAPVLLVSACGGDDDEPTATAPTSEAASEAPAAETSSAAPVEVTGDSEVPESFPCDALTAAEVGAVVGGTYTAGSGPAGECEYDAERLREQPFISIEIPDGQFDLSGISGGTEVPGIGVKGYVRRDTAFPSVTVATGQLDAAGTSVRVTMTGGDEATRDTVAAELLRLAYSKIS